jgi:SpoVK/Ycf46/Vps4 family AAA+-type ATPase
MPYEDGKWVDSDVFRENQRQSNFGGWASQSGKMFNAVSAVREKLTPGIYTLVRNEQGDFFKPQSFPTDDLIELPGLPNDYILSQIKTFWSKKETYKDYGLVHKRGLLLYGPPGCGKTSIIKLLVNQIVRLEGIVLSIDDFELVEDFVSTFRKVQPDTPIMTIMEDIEGYFSGSEGQTQVKAALAFLDGQGQANNIFHVATTNKPEEIEDRFIKRPGRFDLVIGLHTPTAEARKIYLTHIFKKMEASVINEIVEKTDSFELSYLREIVSSYILGISVDDTIKRLQENKETRTFKNKSGYTLGYISSKKE